MAENSLIEEELDFGVEISKRIATDYQEVVACINLEQLYLHLRSRKNLLRRIEISELVFNRQVTKHEKLAQLFNCLESEGPGSYMKFLECLEKESQHMGHEYLTALLKGGQYGEREELEKSAQFREAIQTHMPAMVDIDLPSLVPVMYSHKLLTKDEYDTLTTPFIPHTQKIARLFDQILVSKGPLAHGTFARCLMEEDSQPIHRELYEKMSTEEADLPSRKHRRDEIEAHLPSRKRWRTSYDYDKEDVSKAVVSKAGSLVPVTNVDLLHHSWPGPAKRFPSILEMQKPLKGKLYDQRMHDFQMFQHNGQWRELEMLANRLILTNKPQLQAMALLEKAISFTFRGDGEMVKSCVGNAQALVEKLPIECDNYRFLMARCKHVLSCHHRNAKEYDVAKKLTSEGRVLLSNCEHGEDLSWVNYCDASIRLAETSNPSPREHKEMEDSYRLAIGCARNHTTGTGVVEQHSHIRLAQLALSAQSTSSQAVSPDNLQMARNCLTAVKLDHLSRRSKSLFYIAQSDLYKSDGEDFIALGYAKEAKAIAKKDSYLAVLRSAEDRIDALECQDVCKE